MYDILIVHFEYTNQFSRLFDFQKLSRVVSLSLGILETKKIRVY